MAPLTAAAVAADIQRDDGPNAEQLLGAFRSSPPEGKRILQELASHRDPVVRAWAPWAARRSLSKGDAVALALRLVRDPDPDVRDVALEELLDLDLQAAAKLAPTFRQKLKSKDFYETISGMWALAAIRDTGAMDEIQAAADRRDNDLSKGTAEVVRMLLEGRGDEVIRLIRNHDHRLMPWLSKAARLLGTNEARNALADCSQNAPDDECRYFCQEEVAKIANR
jgi:hypothetical protein